MTNIRLKRKMLAGGIMALMLGCTACSSNENSPAPVEPSNVVGNPPAAGDSQQPQPVQNSGQEETENHSSDWYFENTNLTGNVVDFLEDGFTLSPAIEGDGGKELAIAVPGTEDPDSLVTISYSENIIFEVITMDWASNTMISRETADKETVKKQSYVLIFGTCQDTRNWTADRVVIIRQSR
ncbi:MAG: hypothetical protein J1E01_02225 [Acetatifactor sp.]|nr:hypothetical protein [Acetatifactor sp.]